MKLIQKKTKQICQTELVSKWKELKREAEFQSKAENLLKDLRSKAMRKKGSLLNFWSKQSNEKTNSPEIPLIFESTSSQFVEPPDNLPSTEPIPSTSVTEPKATAKKQIELRKQIELINGDLVGLYKRRDKDLLTDDQEAELRAKKKLKLELETELKKRVGDQNRQQKARAKKKKLLTAACEKFPELRESLLLREKQGRPRIEEEQPLLLKTIVDIALHGSAAHERRQNEVYRSVKTLNDLTEQLNKDGFKISKSGVYLRLIPKRGNSSEGKKHVLTVPVKLIRAQNDHHIKHVDGRFCSATLKRLEELASLLGPQEVCFLSQDDKARVPLGLTAANKQAPLLMHLEYRVSLPDHDWVIAARHKLIPSVIAGIEIKKDLLGKPEAVSYSGPTYIAIRPGKHCSSTAYAHALDFERLLQRPEFDGITKTESGDVKPVAIFTVDGGPDENPRYQKVIDVAIHHFISQNLDALFIATNAPGRSAFNRVERRMAPLSKELAGVILPHDHFGSHLDEQGRTTDQQLEILNFAYAGHVLSEIWSSVVIDYHPTIAEYIEPQNSELSAEQLLSKDQAWISQHVRSSQYFTQIVKCGNRECCTKPRSSYFNAISSRFLPPPIPLCHSKEGLEVTDRSDHEKHVFPGLFVALAFNFKENLPRSAGTFKQLPYDFYCPSVQPIISERICKVCGIYFASKVMLQKHSSEHKKSQVLSTKKIRPIRVAARRQRELMAIVAAVENGEQVDWIEEQELDLTGIIIPPEAEENCVPVHTISEHLLPIWEEAAD